jgi:exodeoxyribonuclease VII large subunit
MERSSARLTAAENLLRGLGPQAVLARGFSMTLDKVGRVVMDAERVKAGETLVTQVARGRIISVVSQ